MRDVLLTLWQHPLPHHFLSRIVHALMRSTALPALRLAFMRWFVGRFGVVLADAAEPALEAYPSFNAFFTRALRPGARPISPEPDAVASPADSCVSQAGAIEAGRVFQAKGRGFSAIELLGGSAADAVPFAAGSFATLYLSPKDYHRVHMPLDGELRAMVHVPGRLFSVSPTTTRGVDRLFARNERVAFLFDTAAGRMAYVMVGALFVSSIETAWNGRVTPPHGHEAGGYTPMTPVVLMRGREMGRFNMGSTVILLFEAGRVGWDPALVPEAALRVGQRIATISGR